jgi:DNA-binding HxlR family transcriptional regulator/DNA-binding transcriptional ArsR family regulator
LAFPPSSQTLQTAVEQAFSQFLNVNNSIFFVFIFFCFLYLKNFFDMQNLQINNPRFITYKDDFLTIDILGGVDLSQVERMICTLRISYQNFPPLRTTLDLYSDSQTDKLQRTLCDKWELKLLEVSKTLHNLTMQLEDYRLQELRFTGKTPRQQFAISEEDKKKAVQFLKNKNLIAGLVKTLNTTGILGEDDNAVILFLASASYKFNNPFSVLCLAKSGIGKSYILQKLSECMPDGSYSFHTRISANALYYFDSSEIQNKALLIEDLEWTTQMLQPLAALQTQGRLVNTRAVKDKDGKLHSAAFEVAGKLCLLACAYSDKNLEEISLPFLCLHLNHSHSQDILIMEYQKQCRAGQIKTDDIKQAQHFLKCVTASLQNISVINPYAALIDLPEDVACPRKSFLLLLNFIEVITCFFQHQREQTADKETGEVFIKTHPDDIELAFKFLRNNLFRRADELSTSVRGFYQWLARFLAEARTEQFNALDIRKAKPINPRTLNRYLQELKLYSYIQVTGGNKHREGFIYKLTNFGSQTDIQNRIEQDLQNTLKNVWEAYHKSRAPKEQQKQPAEELMQEQPAEQPVQQEPQTPHAQQQEQGADRTYKKMAEADRAEPRRVFTVHQVYALTGRTRKTESRHLKTLFDKGLLTRYLQGSQYYYSLAPKQDSKTVSRNTAADPQNLTE